MTEPSSAGSLNPGGEGHPHATRLSDFILGCQDGIVNVLGIILGLAAAVSDVRIVLVATLAAMGAESIAMGAVAYTSTLSRRRLYLSERQRELREMDELPDVEREEVRQVLVEWGFAGTELNEILERICANPRAMLEFMMAFELKLAPVEESAARNSGFLVGGATTVGHLIPLLPFFFVGVDIFAGAVGAIVLSGAALFAIGWYEARVTLGVWWKNGLQMAIIGLIGGFAGFVIGHVIGSFPSL